MPIKGTDRSVHFGLAKLVQVPEKFKDVCTAAPGEGERGSVILEVLAKGVPVTALLVLVAAAGGGGSRRGIGATN